MKRRSIALSAGLSIGVLGLAAALSTAIATASVHDQHAKHVLLLSVDGLHQNDPARYIVKHPESALASLVAGGT